MSQTIPLSVLDPEFLVLTDIEEKTFHRALHNDNADGVLFLCPKCYLKKGSPIGVHSIICWVPSVPQSIFPHPGRWLMDGQLHNLTLTGDGTSSSVLLTSKDGC